MLRVTFAAFVLIAATGCPKPMTDFRSEEFKFQARFPGTPNVRTETAAGISFKMFSTDGRNGAFMIGVADMPIGENEPAHVTEDRLDGAQAGAIRNVGGTLKSSNSITLDGKYPGREFTASITTPKPGQLRARIYLVGRRLYQVLVMGTDSYATGAQATEFLDSFKLIP